MLGLLNIRTRSGRAIGSKTLEVARIVVKTLSGKAHNLHVAAGQTVAGLKAALSEQLRVPVSHFVLLFLTVAAAARQLLLIWRCWKCTNFATAWKHSAYQ